MKNVHKTKNANQLQHCGIQNCNRHKRQITTWLNPFTVTYAKKNKNYNRLQHGDTHIATNMGS
jgi:hypothetical protein